MDSEQLHRQQEHPAHTNYDQPHGGVVRSTGEEEDEHQHEKKSVLKKVKAKAKKIKDTLKHHGHGHDHDRDDAESLEDDETDEDPNVHGGHIGGDGASVVRSTAIHQKTIDDFGDVEKPRVNPTTPNKDRYASKVKDEEIFRPGGEEPRRTTANKGPYRSELKDEGIFQRGEEEPRQTTANKGPYGSELKDEGIFRRGEEEPSQTTANKGQDEGIFRRGEEEPRQTTANKGPYGSELKDEEIFRRGEEEPRQTTTNKGPYGSELKDEEIFRRGEEPRQTTANKGPYGSELKDEGIFRREEEPRQATVGITRVPLQKRQPLISETYPTTAHGIGEGEVLQADVVKVGAPVGLKEDPHAPSHRPAPLSNYESKTFDPTGTGGKEAEINPLLQSFEKMHVGDKYGITPEPKARTQQNLYTGSHDQFAPEPVATDVVMSSNNTESIPKRFDPSKPEDLPVDPIDGQEEGKKSSSATEYAKTAAMTVAEKLAPVYEKVAGAGSAVMEKLPIPTGSSEPMKRQGDGEGKGVTSTVKEKLTPVYEKVTGAGSSLISKVQGPGAGQAIVKEGNDERTDKGVSITEYLAEKLKPGEEDKALSDMISGTLSRQKENTEETGEREVKPMGKVTESEEVARRLGSMDDSPREGSGEKGMVDMLRGAVNSWLGRDNNNNQPQTTSHPRNEGNEVSRGSR